MKIKLSTPAEVRRTLSKIANMLLNNEIDPQRATAITNCCNAVLNCIRIDEQQKKLAELEKLLDEVEAIVYSGTKLNIDYFLEEIMDEDHLLDIYDYFKESTTDKIDDALDELGDDFTEEEVRLVRIKFISEMAN